MQYPPTASITPFLRGAGEQCKTTREFIRNIHIFRVNFRSLRAFYADELGGEKDGNGPAGICSFHRANIFPLGSICEGNNELMGSSQREREILSLHVLPRNIMQSRRHLVKVPLWNLTPNSH